MIRFRVLFGVLLGVLLIVSPMDPPRARAADPACADIMFLGTRGSGENFQARPFSQSGDRFRIQFKQLLPGKNIREWANPYPAVAVAPSSNPENDGGWPDIINGIAAATNAKWLGRYHKSVKEGEQLLAAKITELISSCPTTQLMLGGYSQGAEVTGNVYQRLTPSQRTHILGVVMFADTLFNGSDEAANRGSYDPERNGLLRNAPRGEFPEPNQVLSYCHKLDPVCQGIWEWKLPGPLRRIFNFGQHLNYHSLGDAPGEPLYPDTAAHYFAHRVKPRPPSAGPAAEITPVDQQPPGVLFRVSGCASESEGRPLTYDWDLDNSGAFATRSPGCVLRTSFANTGEYPIALRVTNDAGQRSTANAVIHVVNPDPFTAAPHAPTQVVSTPSGDAAVLTWQPPTSGAPAEGYQVFAADGTVLASIEGGGPGSFRVPAEDLPLAVVAQSINRAGPGGVSPPVTMFTHPALPAGDLNTLWNAYGDQGGHWTGGDSTVSVELPGGRVAWLFSDTFLGTVNPDGSRPRSTPMIRNSIVVQQGNAFTTLHGGSQETPRSLVERLDDQEGFLWVADGTVENNQLKVIYNRYVSVGTDPLAVKQTGAFLATFALPDVTLTGITDLGRGAQIAWISLYEEPDFTYIYGTKTENDVKFLHIARAPAGNIGAAWQFWTGQGWSSSEGDSARVMSGIDGLSITKIGDRYAMFAQDGDGFFSSEIVAYFGAAPTGPFTDKTYLYTAPETAQFPDSIVYGVQLHPEFGAPGKYVLSYNVNTLNEDATFQNARIYRPRFINVALPRPGPNPGSLPAPPTNLRATSDDRGVHLTWTASPTPGVSYYLYQRDVTGGQTQPARVGRPIAGTSYNPRFLKNDRTYEFFVTAVNAFGESPPSNTVSAVPRVRPPAAAPTGLTAQPNPDGTITLSWQPVPDALWYRVFFKDNASPGDLTELNRNIPGTSYTVQHLISGHTYTFAVAGFTEAGAGPRSATVTATARIQPPAAPTNLTARSSLTGDGTIELSWTAPAPDLWYWVYQKDVSAGETDFRRLPYPVTTGTTFSAGLLTSGNLYEFKVSGINGGGEGPQSNVAIARSWTAPPDAPASLRAVPGNRQVTLSWTAPLAPNVWYWIYQRNTTAQEAEFTRLPYPKTDSGADFTAGLLTNGQTYEFYVTAINAGGEGPRSNIVSATPQAPPPAAPTGLTATAGGDASITLTWNAPEPDTWFWLYRRDITAGEAGLTRLTYPVTEGTRFTQTQLAVAHTFEWRVSAINSGGEGALSAIARATTRLDPPRDLRAVPTNDGSALLSWTGPAPDFWYWFYIRDVTAGQGFTRSSLPITSGTAFTAGNLVNGHRYEFYVTTIGPGGAESAPSNVAAITARGGTPSPPTLTARAGDGKVDLSWTATGGMYWVYKRCVSCGETNLVRLGLPFDRTSFTDTGVLNGFTYEYRVSAENVHGEGGWSNAAQARPLPPIPGPPTGLTAEAGDGHVLLRWNPPAPNVWYFVYLRDVTAGQPFQRTVYPISTGPSWDAIYLRNGHVYEFYVTALNVAGEGSRSAIVSAQPMPPFPTQPRDLTFSYGGPDGGTLTWGPPTPPQYYYIYLRNVSKNERYARLLYPVNGTRFEIYGLRLGHRTAFHVTAVDGIGRESAPSNTVIVNPGPRDLASDCAYAHGNATPNGGYVFDSMRARNCGTRRGDFIDIDGWWSSSGRHVNDLSIQLALWDCTTNSVVWWDWFSHPNNPPHTTDSRRWSVWINPARYYRVRVAGLIHLEERDPIFGAILNTVASMMPPPNTPPFDKFSACF